MDDFFRGVATRELHPWPAGRDDLHVHVLFDREEVAATLTRPYQAISHHPGIEPVAPEWLHMTVLHAGPTSSASKSELAAIIDGVGEKVRGIDPFEITFDRPTIGFVALECAGRPGAPARRLWDLTAGVVREVVGDRWPLLPRLYYPHISLGYAGRHAGLADAKALKVALSDIPAGPVTLRATTLSLVSQRHDHRSITWDRIAEIPLGRTASTAA